MTATLSAPRDLIIRGAAILDGTGRPAYQADVSIQDGVIADVGRLPEDLTATEVVDARGLALAPGFIDLHAHADIALLADPQHGAKVRQGVTTEVFSNCGIGFAPADHATQATLRPVFGGLFSRDDGVRWDWTTTAEYLDRLDSAEMAVNAVYLIPHAALRVAAMGMAARPATDAEIGAMRALLRRGLDEGARGLSTGPGYAPMCHADVREMAALAHEACFCAIHQRDYMGRLLESTRESVAIARASEARVQVSHLQTSGPSAEGKSAEAIEILASARSAGLDIACDMYPYTAGSTVLTAILPSWITADGPATALDRLADPKLRERIINELHALDRFWPSMVLLSVQSPMNAPFTGMTFPDIARRRGMSIGELVCTLLVEEELQVCYLVHHMRQDDLDTILSWEHTLIGSDGLHLRNAAHPRLSGTFPRWLGRCVRERRLTTLPDAIRRITSASAQRLGLRDRGLIAQGYAADLVLFDPETIADAATYEDPLAAPIGIHSVWVNGAATIRDGTATGLRAGKVLRD